MQPRDTERFEADEYDLLVIGGSIQGLALAYEAASRGLKTALVEAADFGVAPLDHYETLDTVNPFRVVRPDRVRKAMRERRTLARMAPWFLRPLPFLVGTYGSAAGSRLALWAAFRIDRWLARHRNDGVEPELHLPHPKLISKAATLRLFPGVRSARLTGGAQWYDYQIVERDRLTIAFAAAAQVSGAHIANYVESVSPLKEGSRVSGMNVRDVLNGREFAIRARLTANTEVTRAQGLSLFGVERQHPLIKTVNVLTSRPASDIALAASTSRGDPLTLVPWRGHAMIGPGISKESAQTEGEDATAAELDAFIEDANEAFPALKLTRSDVRVVHSAAILAASGKDGRREVRTVAEIRDHTADGIAGAITVIGTHAFAARGIAERTVKTAGRLLNRRLPPSRTAGTPLPGAAIADHEALAIETARAAALDLPEEITRHVSALYAEASAAIVRLIAEHPDLAMPVATGQGTLGAEVVYAIRNEMAVRLTDVLRRTGLGAAGYPGMDALRGSAALAAPELGWSDARVESEIKAVEATYPT